MSEKVLVLRTCNADYTSHNGFRWPEKGPVECPYWSPAPENNYGLHGLLWGQGDWSQINRGPTAVWQVVEVDASDIVDLGGLVKFRRGNVIYSGHMAEAVTMVLCHPAMTSADQVASGEYSVAASSAKESTSASSGRCSVSASSGDSSTAVSSGYCSRAASNGNCSGAASSGMGSLATSNGNSSTAASSGSISQAHSIGNYSRAASSGESSLAASSGEGSIAASNGNYSRAYARGRDTIAIAAGINCIVSAGENGCFAAVWYCTAQQRFRIRVAYVGRDGIKANTPYRLNAMGQWVEVEAR